MAASLNRWREGEFHTRRALALGAVALLIGGCVQSGPLLLYLNHL